MVNDKRLVYVADVKDLINGLDELPWEENVDDLVNALPTVNAIPIPCQLGDPIYIVVYLSKDKKPSHIVERTVTGIHITEKVLGYRGEKASYYLVTNTDIGHAQHIPFSEIGKTVFFKREDARAVISGKYGDSDGCH